ncbi:unnamed protein product [Choristocarpus tenellus]
MSTEPDNAIGKVVLIGHSTGCQDAVSYMRYGTPELRSHVQGVVLQAPASDREYRVTQAGTDNFVEEAWARTSDELMPRAAEKVPITASRYLSLTVKGGDDDMFSSDLSTDELLHCLGHMNVPTLAVFSDNDQYVPLREGREMQDLAQQLCSAMPGAVTPLVVKGGDHALSSQQAREEFVAAVKAFVSGL